MKHLHYYNIWIRFFFHIHAALHLVVLVDIVVLNCSNVIRWSVINIYFLNKFFFFSIYFCCFPPTNSRHISLKLCQCSAKQHLTLHHPALSLLCSPFKQTHYISYSLYCISIPLLHSIRLVSIKLSRLLPVFSCPAYVRYVRRVLNFPSRPTSKWMPDTSTVPFQNPF